MKLLESYPPTVTSTDIVVNVLFWGGIAVVFFLRNTPPFNTIWKGIVMFFVVLFGTLMWNNIKDKFKF